MASESEKQYFIITSNKYGVASIERINDVDEGVKRFYAIVADKMSDIRPDLSNDFLNSHADSIVLHESYRTFIEVLEKNKLIKEFIKYCVNKINAPWKYYQTVYAGEALGCKVLIEDDENGFTEIGFYKI